VATATNLPRDVDARGFADLPVTRETVNMRTDFLYEQSEIVSIMHVRNESLAEDRYFK
jgi:hypothetical protein